MGIRIEHGKVSDKWEIVSELLHEHWDEIARNKRVMVLKPDIERYKLLEDAGMILAVFAYDGDEIVGYSVSFLTTHLHYSDLVYAQNDALFVRQSHRKGRTGLMLIQETEAMATSCGAQMIIWHAKPDTALDALMPRLGYGVQDIMYSKVLGE